MSHVFDLHVHLSLQLYAHFRTHVLFIVKHISKGFENTVLTMQFSLPLVCSFVRLLVLPLVIFMSNMECFRFVCSFVCFCNIF